MKFTRHRRNKSKKNINKTKQNKTKQNKTKQNKTKQNKTKQNKTKTLIIGGSINDIPTSHNNNEYNKNNTYFISEDEEIIKTLNELGINKSKISLTEFKTKIKDDPICKTPNNENDSLNEYFNDATKYDSLIYVVDNDIIVGSILFTISKFGSKPINISTICSKIRKQNIGSNLLSILKQFSDKKKQNIELSSAIPNEIKYYETNGFIKNNINNKYVYNFKNPENRE